jgi:multimeric flavodoxin WrbA
MTKLKSTDNLIQKIGILSAADKSDGLDRYLDRLTESLKKRSKTVNRMNLHSSNLMNCRGCFDCWVKTPGLCVYSGHSKDSGNELQEVFLNSDFFLMASPVKAGFVSWKLRGAQERLLPNLLPYIDAFKGEAHHLTRYPFPKKLGLILGSDDDNKNNIKKIYQRTALNYRSEFSFLSNINQSAEEAAYEITNN